MFSHFRVSLMLKGLEKSVFNSPKFKGLFQISDLCNIIETYDKLSHPQIFAFFIYFRSSNLVSPSTNQFDPWKHLYCGDVILNGDCVIVIVKWSKTLQTSKQDSYLILLKLRNHQLCPYHNFNLSTLTSIKLRDMSPGVQIPSIIILLMILCWLLG